jgi:hypothetical protein
MPGDGFGRLCRKIPERRNSFWFKFAFGRRSFKYPRLNANPLGRTKLKAIERRITRDNGVRELICGFR